MAPSRATATGDRIIEPMIALAGCSKQHRIVVAGSRGVELMLELHRRGFARAASTANCGHPAGQYDVALVDWRRRTSKALETALDWLDPQKPAATQNLRASLEARGFAIEAGTVHECGCAVSARRRDMHPLRK